MYLLNVKMVSTRFNRKKLHDSNLESMELDGGQQVYHMLCI
jgi:hypothetical protein